MMTMRMTTFARYMKHNNNLSLLTNISVLSVIYDHILNTIFMKKRGDKGMDMEDCHVILMNSQYFVEKCWSLFCF